MNPTSLPQTSQCGAHFLTILQRLHRQLVDLCPLFTQFEALVYFVWRNHHHAVQICNNEVSRIDREWLCLLW